MQIKCLIIFCEWSCRDSCFVLKYSSSFAAVKLAKIKVRAIICETDDCPNLHFCQFYCSERWKVLYMRIYFFFCFQSNLVCHYFTFVIVFKNILLTWTVTGAELTNDTGRLWIYGVGWVTWVAGVVVLSIIAWLANNWYYFGIIVPLCNILFIPFIW